MTARITRGGIFALVSHIYISPINLFVSLPLSMYVKAFLKILLVFPSPSTGTHTGTGNGNGIDIGIDY